jgi:hypothetical protein
LSAPNSAKTEMNYDLRRSNKLDRKRFVAYANSLLKNERNNVSLIDESNRTLNQNSYIHVLCRILASETGVTEAYAKQVYFKAFANPDLFVTTTKDPITNKLVEITRSTRDLTIPEMRKAIFNFRKWAADNGYQLPDAVINDDGTMSFASDNDKEAFHQAIIITSKNEKYL